VCLRQRQLFAGLHEQRLVVRLPAQAGAHPFEVMGKVMKDYAAIADALDCPPAQFRDWIERALAYTQGLPPKKPKGKPKTKKTKPAAKAASRR
jgi:transposase-like protein